MADSTGLAGDSAARALGYNIELAYRVDSLKGLHDQQLKSLAPDVFGHRSTVNRDGAVTRDKPYTRGRVLSVARTIISCGLFQIVPPLRVIKPCVITFTLQLLTRNVVTFDVKTKT